MNQSLWSGLVFRDFGAEYKMVSISSKGMHLLMNESGLLNVVCDVAVKLA